MSGATEGDSVRAYCDHTGDAYYEVIRANWTKNNSYISNVIYRPNRTIFDIFEVEETDTGLYKCSVEFWSEIYMRSALEEYTVELIVKRKLCIGNILYKMQILCFKIA